MNCPKGHRLYSLRVRGLHFGGMQHLVSIMSYKWCHVCQKPYRVRVGA